MQELLQKLKDSYDQLSSGQKKVAKIFFEEPNKIAFSPAFEIGRHVDVSESTVIRLTQKLGYKGYTEVQEIVQKELSKERVLRQYQEMSSLSIEQSFVHRLMDADAENILKMKNNLDEKTFQRVVQLISNTEKVYITGSLFSFGIAHFFTQWMNMTLGNAELIIHGDVQYYQQLSKMTSNDVVIAIIFPRYMNSTLETVQYAKTLGAIVIAITDSELSPVCQYSDLLLKVPIHSTLKIDSYTAVLSLLTSMMRSVAVQDAKKVEENLKNIEKVYQHTNVFYDEV